MCKAFEAWDPQAVIKAQIRKQYDTDSLAINHSEPHSKLCYPLRKTLLNMFLFYTFSLSTTARNIQEALSIMK